MAGNKWIVYKTIKDVQHKLCTGPLHEPGGEYLPMDQFYFYKKKTSRRYGKPTARCKRCERLYQGLDPNTSGLVEVERVRFIFEELAFRIGKAETCRRLGTSTSIFFRLQHKESKRMRKETAGRALKLLLELRQNNEARHRRSIRHGSAQRGKEERVPVNIKDFNGKSDIYTEQRRERRRREDRSY